mgnify:CR=1 FL=1
MRALVQRVSHAAVHIDGELESEIGMGSLVLLGIASGDSETDAQKLGQRVLNYRIFPDDSGRMNCSLLEAQADLLVVSQFTLCADTSSGRRPGFSAAAEPQQAEALYLEFIKACKAEQVKVSTGVFGANMQVSLVNDGPVTFLLES